jgi:hypothetical protein
LERDLDEDPERLDADRDEPERLAEARLVERLEPDRDDEPEPERVEADRFEPEPDRVEPEPDEPEPDRDDDDERAELARAVLAREPELREALDERLEPFAVLRERLDDDRRELGAPLRRSAAGISSLATAFASCGICFSRNLAIRSSSRRMPRASLAVSLSFTASASASMPV